MTISNGTKIGRRNGPEVDGVQGYDWYEYGSEKLRVIVKAGDHKPSIEQMFRAGCMIVIPTDYESITHKLVPGSFSDDGIEIWQNTVKLTAEEIADSLVRLRGTIQKDIRSTANFYLDQLTADYSNTRLTRFQKYLDEINKGNGTYFERMAGASGLTGSQYMLAYVKPMIVAGDRFVDEIIGIETTLFEQLKVTDDRDLNLFDYKTMWDDVNDFVDPPPDNVDPTIWAALKAKLLMKVW